MAGTVVGQEKPSFLDNPSIEKETTRACSVFTSIRIILPVLLFDAYK